MGKRPSRARFACREAIRLPEGEARVAKRPQGAERVPRDAEAQRGVTAADGLVRHSTQCDGGYARRKHQRLDQRAHSSCFPCPAKRVSVPSVVKPRHSAAIRIFRIEFSKYDNCAKLLVSLPKTATPLGSLPNSSHQVMLILLILCLKNHCDVFVLDTSFTGFTGLGELARAETQRRRGGL